MSNAVEIDDRRGEMHSVFTHNFVGGGAALSARKFSSVEIELFKFRPDSK